MQARDQTLTCLHHQQHHTCNVFTSGATFEWVCGPSGAGKTVSAAGTHTAVGLPILPTVAPAPSDEVTVSCKMPTRLKCKRGWRRPTLDLYDDQHHPDGDSSTAGATSESASGGPRELRRPLSAAGTYTAIATNPANGWPASDEGGHRARRQLYRRECGGADLQAAVLYDDQHFTLTAHSSTRRCGLCMVGGGPVRQQASSRLPVRTSAVATNPANGLYRRFRMKRYTGGHRHTGTVTAGADQSLDPYPPMRALLTTATSTVGATFAR